MDETPPAMGEAPGLTGSDGETFAAPVPPALQDRAPAPGAHPLTKTVHLLAAAVVWLKCALHVEMPRLLKVEIDRLREPRSLPAPRLGGQGEAVRAPGQATHSELVTFQDLLG